MPLFAILLKEDGTTAKVDETLDFKVIEFSKENKKILVSHTKIAQDKISAEKSTEKSAEKSKEKTTKKAVKKIKDNIEKTTLGDLDVLANLKADMDQTEKDTKKTKEKKVKSEVAPVVNEEPPTEVNDVLHIEEKKDIPI